MLTHKKYAKVLSLHFTKMHKNFMFIAIMFCTKLTPMSQNGQKLSLIFKTKRLLKFVNSQNKKMQEHLHFT